MTYLKNLVLKAPTAVAIAIGIFSVMLTIASYAVGVAKSDIEFKITTNNKIEKFDTDIDNYDEKFEVMDDRLDSSDLQYVEIKVKLNNIETILLELKKDMKV